MISWLEVCFWKLGSFRRKKCNVIHEKVFVHRNVVDIFQFLSIYADREDSLNGKSVV